MPISNATVTAFAADLEIVLLPKWTKVPSNDDALEADVLAVKGNTIIVECNPIRNCTHTVKIRISYDSVWALHPFSVEADLGSMKGVDEWSIRAYTRFLKNVARLVERISDTANSRKYRAKR
jgi:hypothetical protein